MHKNITELFCFVDDYCKIIDENFASRLLANGKKTTRIPAITYSEIITIILLYHQSRYENFLYTLLKPITQVRLSNTTFL